MIPVHEQRLRAERDAAVAEAAELREQLRARSEQWATAFDELAESIMPDAINALHAARQREWITVAQGIEKLAAARDEHGKSIGDAIQALHDAGVLSFGTVAQGVAKLAAERDAAKADVADLRNRLAVATKDARGHMKMIEVMERHHAELAEDLAEARDAIKGKTFFCAKCEETERALLVFCAGFSHSPLGPDTPVCNAVVKNLRTLGLWRDRAPTDQDDGGEGGR